MPGRCTITRVFGPEVPTGPYKHPASMTELSNGDLYLVYYGGAGEYATETAVFGSRLKKGQTEWTAPNRSRATRFARSETASSGRHPTALVWLFYVVRFGETWSTSRVQFKVSRDHAETWSDASVLSLDEGTMVRNRPIVLKDGDYLLPLYHETGHDPERVGPDSTSLFLRFNPAKGTWAKTGAIRSAKGNIQPAVVQFERPRPGRLLPPRWRLRPQDDRLHRPLRVARRRLDLERGEGFELPEPQRRDRVPQAPERPAAPDL